MAKLAQKSAKNVEITEEMQTIIDDLKEGFKEAEGRSLKLSDNALVFIIEKAEAGGRWDALQEDDAEMLKFLKDNEVLAEGVAIMDAGITTLVSKMDNEFHEELEACVSAVVKSKATAVHMYSQLCRIWTMEELDACPMPGTDKDTVWGNYRPDKVTKVTNTGQEIKTTWSNDLVSYMPEGKEQEDIIDDIAKEAKSPGSVPRLKNKADADLESMKTSAVAKRNAIRSMLKRSIALHHQWRAIEGMPKVGIAWQPAQAGDNKIVFPNVNDYGKQLELDDILKTDCIKASAAPKPIYVWDSTAKPPKGRIFSVTQLINFDVAEAIAKGGTMAELVATAGRDNDNEGDGTGDGSDWDVDTIEGTTSQVVNALNVRATMALILKKIASKKGEGNDLLDNLCTLHLLTKQVYEKNRTAYEALQVRPDSEEKIAV